MTPGEVRPRTTLLKLLNGERGPELACFSCLSTIIAPALENHGLEFHEVHHDARKMVTAAASAFELYGWPSATLPTDLIVEAEALGAEIDFRKDMPEAMWPIVPQPLFAASGDVFVLPGDFAQRGRIPLVCDAIRELKARVGSEIVVGAWIAGPFTLGMQVVEYNALLAEVRHSPRDVTGALDTLTEGLVSTANAYRAAGADLITIHEMGGSPGVLGPAAFGELVLPHLQRITGSVPAPCILSVCGNTNNAMELVAQAGAAGLNVDQTNDLAHSRAVLGRDVLLFGNIDPVGVIAHGSPETIRAAVERAANAGADAIMPGCDLYLQTPAGSLQALLAAATGFVRRLQN